MAEQIEQAARTAGRTFNISLAELAGANAGQRNDLLALNQAVYRVPDGTLYTSDGAQLVPAQGLPVMANTNPLTGGIELTAGGEVVEVGGGSESQTQVAISQNIDSSAVGKKIVSTAATAITLTVLNDATGGFTGNAHFSVTQFGAGAVTVAAGSGVVIRVKSGFPAQVQYDTVKLTRIAANDWVME